MSRDPSAAELEHWLEDLRRLTEESGERLHSRVKEVLRSEPPATAALLMQPLRNAPMPPASSEPATFVMARSEQSTVVLSAVTVRQRAVTSLPSAAAVEPTVVAATPNRAPSSTSLVLGMSYPLFLVSFVLALGLELLHLRLGLPLWFVLAALLGTDIAICLWFAEVRAQLPTKVLLTGWLLLLTGPSLLLRYGAALRHVAARQGRTLTVPKTMIVIAFTVTTMWLLWSLIVLGIFGREIVSSFEQRLHLFVVTHILLNGIWGILLGIFGMRVRSLR